MKGFIFVRNYIGETQIRVRYVVRVNGEEKEFKTYDEAEAWLQRMEVDQN